MKTAIEVLGSLEKDRVHESTLDILANTGVMVNSALGRKYLAEAGAEVDKNTNIVRFPRQLVEECLKLAPKQFKLGARRPGWDLEMNGGDCMLVADGEATYAVDWPSTERRIATMEDWLIATRVLDSIDDIGVYWAMVESGLKDGSQFKLVKYWRHLLSNFSKHLQDVINSKEQAPWILEILQVVFGDKQVIREQHPLSLLLCPQSPLMIDKQYTDAYLAMTGWDIPVAIMPMPLMGGTGPANMISMVIQGNCEVLSMLCLVQAATPGTPVIYAPVLAAMDPHTGLFSGGAIENGILGVAAIEMGRYYGLPVEGVGGGTSQFIPGIQAGYERVLTGFMPTLKWPDLIVGPGLVGNSMVLSLEQLVIDVEIFRMSMHAYRGIDTREGNWLNDVIQQVGPGGHYLSERSTVQAFRNGEMYLPNLGYRGPYLAWKEAGGTTLLQEAHEKVEYLLANYDPLPLSEEVERELGLLQKKVELTM